MSTQARAFFIFLNFILFIFFIALCGSRRMYEYLSNRHVNARALLLGPSHTSGDSKYGGKRRRQATAQAEWQIHATNVCTRTLATYVHSSSARAVPYIWQSLHTRVQIVNMTSSSESSLPMKTIIWCCFAASVDAVMLRSDEKTNKRRRTV